MAHPMPREFKLKMSEWPEADLAAVADIKMCPELADGLENFRALSIQILSILGVWSMTLPLASLAVVFAFQDVHLPTDLEVDDLGPFPEQIKALDHFETLDMSPDEKRVLLGKIRLVECDEYCIRVLKARQTEGVLSDAPIWTDVTTYEPTGSDLAATVVAAGFPCQ
eukprot:symbB.v1.2.001870.t1/scaffold79.1/size344139/1